MRQLELFEETGQSSLSDTINFYLPDSKAPEEFGMPPELARLFELSADAFYSALYAGMSELPIKGEITRFIEKVCTAGNGIADGLNTEARAAAARAASDRGDRDVIVVLKAACQVQHEIHRLTGFLRFSPDPRGVYSARCSPDHFILPALAEHFTIRFGETPWAIIDEKRGLCLSREKGGEAQISPLTAGPVSTPNLPLPTAGGMEDTWEDLWRLYHRSVNNEAKKNLKLQRQFMPARYQRYLTELQ